MNARLPEFSSKLAAILVVLAAFLLGCIATWGVMRSRPAVISEVSLASLLKAARAEDFVNLSRGLLDDERTGEAISVLERGLAVFPSDSGLRNNLGYAQLKAGRIGAAEITLSSLVREQPDHSLARGNLAVAIARREAIEARIEDARRSMASSDRASGGYARLQREIGFSWLQLEQPAKALATFDEALAIDAGDHESLNGSGVALMRTKDYEEALRRFRKAVDLKPDVANYWANAEWARRELLRDRGEGRPD
jgi:Flp pilus assembly protein TadD